MSTIAKRIFALMMGMCCVVALHAQRVNGVVKDSSGEPVVGAFITVQGTSDGVSSGLDGGFTIQVKDPIKAVLEVSMIGLKTAIIELQGRTQIEVILEDDHNLLDETVVVGYATVKRRDLLGSVSSVAGDKLTEQPVTSVSQALSGKMAGVSVVTTEGDPDADIKIRVRGGGSITQDNSPLYIVDGFPVASINDIASSEIASIDVLKDAFSTAIYGSRGANGVIIITTKSAEKGRKVSVKLNAYAGMKRMANADAIQAMDAENYVKFQYELAKVRGNVNTNYEPYFGSFNDMDLYTSLPTNDWVDMVFGNIGSNYNVDFSVSGTGEGFNWTLSYARLGDNAIMTGSNYTRDNISFKSKFNTSKTTSVDLNVRYSRTNVRGAGANSINDSGTNSGNGRLKHAVSYAPIPVKTTLQNIDEEADYGDNAPPLLSVADNDSRRIRNSWTANAAFNWEIASNLRLKIDGGIEDFRQEDEKFYGITTYYAGNVSKYAGTPSNLHTDYDRRKLRNTNTLTYDFADVFADSGHHLNLLVGQEMTYTKSSTLKEMVENFPTFYDSEMAWNFISSGTPLSSSKYYNPDDVLLSFFGRINYDYKQRYSIGATFRADGSSKFGKNNRWGYFPSAAASWTISNEEWMQGAGWIEQLKLRYSYGTAGNNNIPAGQLNKEYSASATPWLSMSDTYWMAGKILNNPDLKWETTITNNIGLDFSFFDGRISGSIEAYQNDTKDLLILFPIAGTGYENQYRNIGSTRNRGAELTLTMPLIMKKDYSLAITGNIAYNQNLITSLGGLEAITGRTVQSYWASTEIGDDYRVEVGQPLGNMYGYISDGRYSVDDFDYLNGKWVLKEGVADCSSIIGSSYMMPGALKLKADADGKIRKHIIGNATPDFQGGFGINGNIKGLDFSANFSYMIGNEIYNANKVEFTSSRKFYNRNLLNTMDVDKRWTNIDWTTGELVTDPELLKSMNRGNTMWSPFVGSAVFSDWAVEDGSFLRLQSATIGYTLPSKLTERASIRKLRFYVTGTNLFCLTNYSGYDPEVDTRRSTPLTPGVDYSAYPKSIGCVFGVNLTF